MSLRPLQFAATLLLAILVIAPAHGHGARDANALAASQTATQAVVTGVVDALVIEDQVGNTVLRYYALRLDDGQMLALTGAGVGELSSGQRVELTGNLSGDTLEVTGFGVAAAAQSAAKRGAPSPSQTQVTGTLVIFHADYFGEGRGDYGLGVHDTAAHMTPLNVAVVPDTLRPGMTVTAYGTTAADGVSMDTNQITIVALPPAQNQPAGAPITNQVLVIPIKFADSPASDPFTTAQIDQVMRTNANSVAAYYNEVSYGQQPLSVTVAHSSTGGWLQSSSATPANCDFTSIGNLADAAATAAGYNLANYTGFNPTYKRFYVMPGGSGCGWAGLAYIGPYYQAWSNGYNALWVYGHELGHNFTLYHAGSVNCSPQVLGGSCSVAEYGDRFDVMGNNANTGEQMHFNAYQKSALGWIPASSVVTHSGGTATYTLSPLESGGQSTYAVKIPVAADTSRTYWIEYRQPIGFDSGIAAYPNLGAIIHVSSPFDYASGADDTEILDPGATGSFFNAALLVGQTYTDSTYGISIKVNSATASALSVTVAMNGGQTTSTTTLGSSANPSLAGANVTFTATVTGSAPTGSVAFSADGTTLAGCGAVALAAGSAGSKTATCSTASLAVGTHSIVANYGGDANNTSSGSAPLSQVVNSGGGGGSVDVALAVNGGVATASSTYTAPGYSFPVSAVNDGDRTGLNWGNGGGWNSGTANVFPDWVQINFNGQKTINKVIVYTVQDNYANPVDPPDNLTFTLYGVTDFQVQGWNGSAWVTLGTVSGNNLVKRTVTFGAYTTDRIRVNVTAALASYARIVEIAAWTGTGGAGAATTTTLSSSPNPSGIGKAVTFTATVTGSNPTGTVNFTADGASIAGCSATPLASGIATCVTSSLANGTHSIVANYSGDASNQASASAPLSQAVKRHGG